MTDQKVKTYYKPTSKEYERTPEKIQTEHAERRQKNREIRERSPKTPTGQAIARVTNRTISGVGEFARSVPGRVVTGWQNIAANARESNPYNAINERKVSKRSGGSGNFNPLALMAPPSYYGGMPGMEPEHRATPRKRKRRREPPDDEPAWQHMSGIPPEARRWMM